jgi:hypothetical protein
MMLPYWSECCHVKADDVGNPTRQIRVSVAKDPDSGTLIHSMLEIPSQVTPMLQHAVRANGELC